MAEEYETDAREQKAWRRVVAAARKLAKQQGDSELGEAVATANHQDTSTRDMRRMEALAALLESLVSEEKPEAKPAKSKSDKEE